MYVSKPWSGSFKGILVGNDESKPNAESKNPAPKSSVYRQSSKDKHYVYIDLLRGHIIRNNIYTNIFRLVICANILYCVRQSLGGGKVAVLFKRG